METIVTSITTLHYKYDDNHTIIYKEEILTHYVIVRDDIIHLTLLNTPSVLHTDGDIIYRIVIDNIIQDIPHCTLTTILEEEIIYNNDAILYVNHKPVGRIDLLQKGVILECITELPLHAGSLTEIEFSVQTHEYNFNKYKAVRSYAVLQYYGVEDPVISNIAETTFLPEPANADSYIVDLCGCVHDIINTCCPYYYVIHLKNDHNQNIAVTSDSYIELPEYIYVNTGLLNGWLDAIRCSHTSFIDDAECLPDVCSILITPAHNGTYRIYISHLSIQSHSDMYIFISVFSNINKLYQHLPFSTTNSFYYEIPSDIASARRHMKMNDGHFTLLPTCSRTCRKIHAAIKHLSDIKTLKCSSICHIQVKYIASNYHYSDGILHIYGLKQFIFKCKYGRTHTCEENFALSFPYTYYSISQIRLNVFYLNYSITPAGELKCEYNLNIFLIIK